MPGADENRNFLDGLPDHTGWWRFFLVPIFSPPLITKVMNDITSWWFAVYMTWGSAGILKTGRSCTRTEIFQMVVWTKQSLSLCFKFADSYGQGEFKNFRAKWWVMDQRINWRVVLLKMPNSCYSFFCNVEVKRIDVQASNFTLIRWSIAPSLVTHIPPNRLVSKLYTVIVYDRRKL